MAQPTTKQKLAFGELLRKIESGESFNLKTIMLDSGYTEATAKNPEKNLTGKTGWQLLLAQIDDKMILAKFYEILFSDDKRSSMDAGKELLKLKDKYPATKIKQEVYDQRDKVLADIKEKNNRT